jgi:superfamily I DNA and/or RNA helicase
MQATFDEDSELEKPSTGIVTSGYSSVGDHPKRVIRLRAMTVASVIAKMSELAAHPKFDLIIFDEASQIGLAHALMIMTLGKSWLFAGDPEQLSPIAKSDAKSVQRWLLQSPFACMPKVGPNVCLLTEQSRSAGPICAIVSELFYESKLVVATDAVNSPKWKKDRERNFGDIPIDEHVRIQHVATNAIRSKIQKGWFRPESVDRITKLVLAATRDGHATQREIIVLTPYRLQCAYLLEQFHLYELPLIKVSTVHGSQGSEAPFVIFDPVRGCDEFLRNRIGRQLINVALSRAQAKLIVMLSREDLQNPLFAQMQAIVERSARSLMTAQVGPLLTMTNVIA